MDHAAHSPSEPNPATLTALRPVQETERIVSLDVLRGFALLGVFIANMAVFSGPLGKMIDLSWLADETGQTQLLVGLIKVFVDGKFITLFSILFGVGMVVQLSRAQRAGRTFTSTYIRRLVVLAAIGLVHALLIWFGDILVMYAVAGTILLLFQRVSGKAMLAWAGGLLILSLLMFMGMQALGIVMSQLQEQAASESQVEAGAGAGAEAEPEQSADDSDEAVEADAERDAGEPSAVIAAAEEVVEAHDAGHDDRWARFMKHLRNCQGDPSHPSFAAAETIAYKEGPLLAAVIIRAIKFLGFSIFFGILSGFGLRIVAVFLIGAGLMKLGFFSTENRRWHWRCFIVGVGLGLPAEAAIMMAIHHNAYEMNAAVMMLMTIPWLTNIILCLGYVGGVCLLVHAGALQWLQKIFAAIGRMALTNYLMQSLVATFIFYWWGLGLFGELDKATQLGIVAGVYAAQVIFSMLWLSVFTFGPMEWLWRSLTYMKLQPLLRRA